MSRIVLALGETTGHAHLIEGSVLVATSGGRALLDILESRISHPNHDHAPRPIDPGWYEIIRHTLIPRKRPCS